MRAPSREFAGVFVIVREREREKERARSPVVVDFTSPARRRMASYVPLNLSRLGSIAKSARRPTASMGFCGRAPAFIMQITIAFQYRAFEKTRASQRRRRRRGRRRVAFRELLSYVASARAFHQPIRGSPVFRARPLHQSAACVKFRR